LAGELILQRPGERPLPRFGLPERPQDPAVDRVAGSAPPVLVRFASAEEIKKAGPGTNGFLPCQENDVTAQALPVVLRIVVVCIKNMLKVKMKKRKVKEKEEKGGKGVMR